MGDEPFVDDGGGVVFQYPVYQSAPVNCEYPHHSQAGDDCTKVDHVAPSDSAAETRSRRVMYQESNHYGDDQGEEEGMKAEYGGVCHGADGQP